MSTTYELHGEQTGNCIRAAIALGEAGLPYTIRHVDLAAQEHKGSAYLALNPAGKVPVLVRTEAGVRRFALAQSNAIMLYAAERSPGRLLPVDADARAIALERFFFFVTDVIAPSHAAFALRRAKTLDGQAVLTARMLDALASAERFLNDAPFMAGESFTLADIAGFTIAASVEAQMPWAQLPRLRSWYERIAARAAVARGMLAFTR